MKSLCQSRGHRRFGRPLDNSALSLDTIEKRYRDPSLPLMLTFLTLFDRANIQDELFRLARVNMSSANAELGDFAELICRS